MFRLLSAAWLLVFSAIPAGAYILRGEHIIDLMVRQMGRPDTLLVSQRVSYFNDLRERGLPLERVVAVDSGGDPQRWPDVVAAAADGFDVLLVRVPTELRPAMVRKLTTRIQQRSAVVVVLGDNIIEGNIKRAVADFFTQPTGGKILLKEVPDPHRFGVARMEGDRVAEILEKPKNPPTNHAVIGIYMYDNDVFEICRTLKPSGRGELEITDVNNAYIERGDLTAEVLEGWWTDAGTFESLYRASSLVAEGGANHVEGQKTSQTQPAGAA